MGLRRPNQFTKRGRRLPGQSNDEELGLERSLQIKVYGAAAVIEEQLIQIGDIGKGDYIELGPEGIKIYNEGAVTEVWSNVDGGAVQTELRVQGKNISDQHAWIGLVATDYGSSTQVSFTLDTKNDRATLSAGQLLIGSNLRLTMITTAQRDALSAVNGMIIYNLTTNKFQGYAGGSWVDLH